MSNIDENYSYRSPSVHHPVLRPHVGHFRGGPNFTCRRYTVQPILNWRIELIGTYQNEMNGIGIDF